MSNNDNADRRRWHLVRAVSSRRYHRRDPNGGWCMGLAPEEWRNKVGGRAALTLCRAQREEVMRAAKNGQRVRRTHFLSRAERRSREGSRLMPASEGHLPPVESREESAGQQDKVSKQGALTIC